MSSCFTFRHEQLWMSNGSAELHVEEWRDAVRRTLDQATAAVTLEGFLADQLEASGLGLYGFDVEREELSGADVRDAFACVVATVGQDIVHAAVGARRRRDGETSVAFSRP